jgi:hypothetical protein
MYKKILVSDDIQQGRILLDALRKRPGFPVTEAFWYELPEFGKWRLIIATPVAHTAGPIAAYTMLHETLKQLGTSLDSSNISLLRPNSNELERLREAAFIPRRPRRGPLQDLDLQDAYVYSLPKQATR